jgi:succinate-semialdehyde dehydrogenase/glutarate-semialdehyde dehydrogenase
MSEQPAVITPPEVEPAHAAPGTAAPASADAEEGRLRVVVERARVAQAAWRALVPEERRARLLRVGVELRREADSLAAALGQEGGWPAHLAYGCELAEVLHVVRALEAPGGEETGRAPRGVVGLVTSWDSPLAGVMVPALAALAAGNAVVVKPSASTPHLAQQASALLERAGVGPGIVTVVTGGAEAALALARAGVEAVHVAGERDAVRAVACACAAQLVPCAVDLRGGGVAVVCADADVERTAQALAWAAFSVGGGLRRGYVARRLVEEVRARVVALARGLRVGGPPGEAEVGPCPSVAAVSRFRAALAEARGAGAVVEGEADPAGETRLLAPVVVTRLEEEAALCAQAPRGPALVLLPVGDDEEALRRASLGSPQQGWVSSVDEERAQALAWSLPCASVVVNGAWCVGAAGSVSHLVARERRVVAGVIPGGHGSIPCARDALAAGPVLTWRDRLSRVLRA